MDESMRIGFCFVDRINKQPNEDSTHAHKLSTLFKLLTAQITSQNT